MSKRTHNLPETTYPIVNVQRFQTLKCEVDARRLDELARYISYVESVTRDKPTEGEVVGAALTELFKLDRGFQKWKDEGNKPDTSHQRSTELRPIGKV